MLDSAIIRIFMYGSTLMFIPSTILVIGCILLSECFTCAIKVGIAEVNKDWKGDEEPQTNE
jgi:hypothetical protein